MQPLYSWLTYRAANKELGCSLLRVTTLLRKMKRSLPSLSIVSDPCSRITERSRLFSLLKFYTETSRCFDKKNSNKTGETIFFAYFMFMQVNFYRRNLIWHAWCADRTVLARVFRLAGRSTIAGILINRFSPPGDLFSSVFRPPPPARMLLLFIHAGSPDTAASGKMGHFPRSRESNYSRSFLVRWRDLRFRTAM